MATNYTKDLYDVLDEYYEKFGVDYKIEMFSKPPQEEVIKDIRECIKNNKKQPEWDRAKNKDIII